MIQMNEPLIIRKDIYNEIATDLDDAIFFIDQYNYVQKYNEDNCKFYIYTEHFRQSSSYLIEKILPILEKCSQYVLNTNTWKMIIVGEVLEDGISIYQIKNKKFKYKNINLEKIINNVDDNDEPSNELHDED